MITKTIYDEFCVKIFLWLTEGQSFYPNYMKPFYLSEARARNIIDRVWLALTEEDKENERYDHLIKMIYLLAEGYNNKKT